MKNNRFTPLSYVSSLLETNLNPLFSIDIKGVIIDLNQAAITIIGIERDVLIGSNCCDYFSNPQKGYNAFKKLFNTGSLSNYPLSIKHIEGKVSHLVCNAIIYKDEHGSIIGALLNMKDRVEKKIKLSSNKMASLSKEKNRTEIEYYTRSLIEASRDPLFTINPKGQITDLNVASEEITGVSKKVLIGSNFFDYFTNPKNARKAYKEVFLHGYIADYPLTIRNKKLTEVLFNGAVYKNDTGKVIGVVVIARDVTKQKHIENELVKAKSLAEHTSLLAQEAKTNAENTVKAKQQFLSNMSHEIRTPMNAIIGFTKVLLNTKISEKQKEYLNAIKLSGDALIVLINDILDIAKVDAGKMTFEKIPFKIANSVSSMIHLFETKIQEKNIALIKQYDYSIPEILIGDPVRLNQIILNLLSNAVKFTSQGKITICIKILSENEKNVSLQFSVEDTGIGIDAKKIDTIFEKFQQAHSGTSRLYGGTGLGLAIAKQLVENQGGTISVESTKNIGSKFSFTLSFNKTNAEIVTEIKPIQLISNIHTIKILVVEDIIINQLLMKTILDNFKFKHDIVSNGKIAIEKLQTNKYDIILMDLQMPQMNGFEATDYIRNEMKLNIPIIALTADVTTVDLKKCKEIGMNDYLAKPVDEELLYNKIYGFVSKKVIVKKNNKKINTSKTYTYINLQYINNITNSNSILMTKIISAYLEQTPTLLHTLQKSLQNKDWNTMNVAIHKMIPSFSIMGIGEEYENMAKKVQEYSSAQEHINEIPNLISKIKTVCIHACKELRIELDMLKRKINEK